ncbi:hypothetical protein UT300016_17890 [Clostridium senegalense]
MIKRSWSIKFEILFIYNSILKIIKNKKRCKHRVNNGKTLLFTLLLGVLNLIVNYTILPILLFQIKRDVPKQHNVMIKTIYILLKLYEPAKI